MRRRHLFDKCPYAIESIRLKGWKPDPAVMERFEKIKRSPRVKSAIDAAMRRANESSNKEPSLISVCHSKLLVVGESKQYYQVTRV